MLFVSININIIDKIVKREQDQIIIEFLRNIDEILLLLYVSYKHSYVDLNISAIIT